MRATYTRCPACRSVAGRLTRSGLHRECVYCHHTWAARTRKTRSPVVSLAYAEPKSGLAGRETRDCAVRALAVAACVSYDEAHAACKAEGRRDRQGTYEGTLKRAAMRLAPGASCLRYDDGFYGKTARDVAAMFPVGHFVLWSRNHAFALCDGVLHDWDNRSGLCRVVGGVRLA